MYPSTDFSIYTAKDGTPCAYRREGKYAKIVIKSINVGKMTTKNPLDYLPPGFTEMYGSTALFTSYDQDSSWFGSDLMAMVEIHGWSEYSALDKKRCDCKMVDLLTNGCSCGGI